MRVGLPGAVAPLAAALARHPNRGVGRHTNAVRDKAHSALEKLGYTDAGVELPTAVMSAARVVALMHAGAADARTARAGAESLRDIAASDAGRAACVAADAPGILVSILTTHVGVATVCHFSCWALTNIASSDAGTAACVAAGAPHAVVAALTTHARSSDVLSYASRRASSTSSIVCLYASWALLNLAGSDPAHRAAIVAAGAVAPLAAALARHPGETREKAHAALEKLGYTDAGVKK